MKENKRNLSWVLILISILFLVFLLFFGYKFLTFRIAVHTPPPLVLIHKPYNYQEISLATGARIHATATSDKGISRIELWVDKEYITSVEAPESGPITPMVLGANWQPLGAGPHEIIVRAYDGDQFEGVSSILVSAVYDGDPIELGFNPLDEVADEGLEVESPDEGDMGDAGPSGGEDPSGGGSGPAPSGDSGDGGAEDSDREGPPPMEPGVPPPSMNLGPELTMGSVFDLLFGDDGGVRQEYIEPEGMVRILFEALGLETGTSYEGVHCYVRLGHIGPYWLPDTDRNQDTDEHFSSLGGNQWNIADYLAGDNGITAPFQNTEAIPMMINCIGFSGDGMVSFDLGTAEFEILPEERDGITRVVEASAEGNFRLSYRVTQEELTTKELDPTIPVPYNLRINESTQELLWDWDPGVSGEGEGVVGFMIYLNDNLVLNARSRDDRSISIPHTWLLPPCRTNYEFTIRAYRYPYPDGDFSNPSTPLIYPDPSGPVRTNCQPGFIVTFNTLITGNLSGDDRPNNWANLVGPVSGSFFAGGEETLFDGVDLLPNQTYDLSELISTTTDYNHYLFIEPEPEENVRVGFDLAEYEGWDGFRNICGSYYHDYSFSELMSRGYVEDVLYSVEENDGNLCVVNYTIRPMDGRPLGTGSSDFFPLPWLDLVGMRMSDAETPTLLLEIQNNGNAPWTNQDLKVELIDRETDSVMGTQIETHTIVVGETITLNTGYGDVEPSRVCVKIDPDNWVQELYEATGALDHTIMQYCLPLPDLRLTNVYYDHAEEKLMMHVWNTGSIYNSVGSSDFDLGSLSVSIDPDESDLFLISYPGQFDRGILSNGNDIWLEWRLRPGQYELMAGGYTVQLDPYDRILETNEDNNSQWMRGGATLQVMFDGMSLNWYPNWLQSRAESSPCHNYGRWAGNDTEVWVDVYARSDTSNLQLTSWHWSGEVGGFDSLFQPPEWDPWIHVVEAYLNGDESLTFEIRGEQSGHSMGSQTAAFPPDLDWLSMETIEPGDECDWEFPYTTKGIEIVLRPSRTTWYNCGDTWSVFFNVCVVED